MKAITLLLSLIFSYSTLTSEIKTCAVESSSISCGGTTIENNGCNISCDTSVGYEPICYHSECHILAHDRTTDSLCSQQGVTCANGEVYVYSPASCFCD